MIIQASKRRVIINTPQAAAVAQLIPHAKTAVVDGQTLVAVPMGVDEMQVLRNMGFSAPTLIEHVYDWPGRFKPMKHQVATAAFASTHKRALILNAPGTGKTVSTLWAADFLMTEGAVRKVLVVAPLSTLKVVWAQELRHHFPHRSVVVCTGSREKRLSLLQTPGVQYVIINHDGFTGLAKELNDFDLVIYDEATALKTPGSQRYKLFSKWVAKHKPWLWLLTGTPIAQSPVDAWTLARLVDSPRCPGSFTTFKDKVMERITSFKFRPRPDALQTCKEVLQPSIRFSLDECKDLPATSYLGRKTVLTPAQDKSFFEMRRSAVTTLSVNTVSAANAAVVMSKLLQICCGVVHTDVGTEVIDTGPRIDTLTELIDEIGDKVIVFCPLRPVIEMLNKELLARGYDAVMVHGGVTKKERDLIFTNFQHADSPKVLLAHPRVAAHGLTLTRARDIIWFAPVYSLEQYEQANARIRRLTTDDKTRVWHLWATPFEKELYRRLRHKQSILTDFLAMVNGVNED